MNDIASVLDNPTGHRHTKSCYWQHEQGRWICRTPDVAAPAPEPSTIAPERPLVDVRDMIVVHTAMLREFRLAGDAVLRVPAGARGQAQKVDQHLALLCDLLHHHHEGEDALLWPPLRARVPAQAAGLLDAAEAEHAGLDQALDEVAAARRAWLAHLDVAARATLVDTLRTLYTLLAAHLDAEERHLLPLAATYLTEAEWQAVGAAGAASVPRSKMPLVFGMFCYEGDPEVLADMLKGAPAPVRLIVPRVAPRVYARRAAALYGTGRP